MLHSCLNANVRIIWYRTKTRVKHPLVAIPGKMTVSLAWTWKIWSPYSSIAAMISMPCHIRCDGSILTPMFLASIRSANSGSSPA